MDRLDFMWLTWNLVLGLVMCSDQLIAEGELPLGIVKEKPASGPCVPLNDGRDGYMVPYVHTLGETGVSIEMIPVPGGRAMLGSPDQELGRSDDEGPCFEVQLEPYWIGKTEITWAQFSPFMRSYDIFRQLNGKNYNRVPADRRADAVTVPTPLYAPNHHREFSNTQQHPAVTMTQYSAKQYTKWLSGVTGIQYRLPTEAEWEYAARAGSKAAYCFGDDVQQLGEYAVFSTEEGAAVVGSKQPNAFGLYDMHGNVWEWTVEQYSADGYASRGGKLMVGFDGVQWPTQRDSQCVRGGCWQDDSSRLRSASRMGSDHVEWTLEDPEVPTSPWWYTSDPSRMVGMRLVRSVSPLPQDLIRRFWETEIPELQDDINMSLQEGRSREGIPSPELLDALKRKPKTAK
jgi:formylglycine-generating enzyme